MSPNSLLRSIPSAGDLAAERIWLHDLLAWILAAPADYRTERLSILTNELNQRSDAKEVYARLSEIWNHHSAGRLLSEAGLPDEVFFFRELTRRAIDRILPTSDLDEDLYTLLESLDLESEDAEWIQAVPDTLWQQWAPILTPGRKVIETAARALSVRAAAIGLSRDLLRLTGGSEDESPFFGMVGTVAAAAAKPSDAQAQSAWERRRSECLETLSHCHLALESRGASAAITFRLQLVQAQVGRIHTLLLLLRGEALGRKVVGELVGGFVSQRGFFNIIGSATRRLAQKVVEQAGRAGEHYVAHDHITWARMGWGGVGAGAITAFTAFFKYGINGETLAPLLVGVGHAINYSGAFILMQLFSFLLASKMPAMTGAALAGETRHKERLAFAASIVRTQVVVTMANVVATVLVAFAIDRLIILRTGDAYLKMEQALHGVHSLHPLHSLTIPFAAITGVLLWISSLMAGWTSNWMLFHGLGEGIRKSFRLRRRIGIVWMARLASFVEHHLPGIAGYLVLGILLGLLPVLCQLLGIPLEVRHVTLASASLAFDLDRLLWEAAVPWKEVAWAAGGLLCVGILNLSASFACGFLVALRARPQGTHGAGAFFRSLVREFVRSPRQFLFPVGAPQEPDAL